jgi:hypothetical protein
LDDCFECLKEGSFLLLPLGEALQGLRVGTLPPRSGALTFDGGPYDFFRQAYPLLKADGFPVTVYQTSYYISVERPVFHLICSSHAVEATGPGSANGEGICPHRPLDLRTESARAGVVRDRIEIWKRETKPLSRKMKWQRSYSVFCRLIMTPSRRSEV